MGGIADRLKGLRVAAGMSQDALGRKLGHNQRWVSQRERGVVDVSVDEAVRISEALGYQASFVVLPRHTRLSLDALEPDELTLVAQLIDAIPSLSGPEQGLIRGMLRAVLERRQAG